MGAVLSRLATHGYSETALSDAFGLVSPRRYTLLVPPDRVQITYARYDQLTPVATTLEYARAHRVRDVQGYARSHSTVLLTAQLYRDYAHFIDRVGW